MASVTQDAIAELRKVRERFLPPAKEGGEDIIRALMLTTIYGERMVLGGIDLAIRRGEVFVIMGPSGCGKTTLMRHLCGLVPPTMGSVFVGGYDIYDLSEEGLKALRLCTGLSFQGGALLGSLTVEENVALPLRENTDLPDELIRHIARMKLEQVELLHAADLLPASLSGGMLKRAAIARAIALDPDIVFLDEPSAGLDPVTAAGVDNLIKKLNKVFGITMVVVTHDLDSAKLIADRAVLLSGGFPMVVGDKETVWAHPDPTVQAFLYRRLLDDGGDKNDIGDFLTSGVQGGAEEEKS